MNELRPETDVMQFGEDWPGIFVRGDDALGYTFALQLLIDQSTDHVAKRAGTRLLNLLSACNVRLGGDPGVQKAVMHAEGYRYCAERGMVKKKDVSIDKHLPDVVVSSHEDSLQSGDGLESEGPSEQGDPVQN